MCLDIDPSSVIHKHLNKKIYNTVYEGYEYLGDGQCDYYRHSRIIGESYGKQINNRSHKDHNLTMLPSFHISLEKPTECENTKTIIRDRYINTASIVGDITLAPICISEKNNKKSAWIPLHPYFYTQIHQQINKAFERNNYQPYEGEEEDLPYKYLHISLANLTGKPRDSIARPEDCIIDTINN